MPASDAKAPLSAAAQLAAMFNVAAVDDSDIVAGLERHKRLNEIFLGAIQTADKYSFDRALEAGADVNYAGGKPLAQAAAQRNFIFMKELVVRGASFEGAIAALENEQSGISRRERTNDWGERTGYSYKNKDEERRWKAINAQLRTLKDYQKVFVAEILPLETLRLQHETLLEVRALRRDVAEAIHGKPMVKPKLKAPQKL